MRKVTQIIISFMLVLLLIGCSSKESSEISANSVQNTSEENNSSTSEITGTEITIEDILCTEKSEAGEYINYTLKIRNNTEDYIDHVEVNYQLIDSAGDSLNNNKWYFNDLEPGQATSAQIQINNQNSYKLSEVVAIRIRSIDAFNLTNNTMKPLFSYRLSEPIIYPLKDIPMK